MTALAGVFVGRGQVVHAAPKLGGVTTGPPLCGQRGRRYLTGGPELVTCQRCRKHLPEPRR